MPGINTRSNNSSLSVSSPRHLSPIQADNINNNSSLASVINTTSTLSLPSPPPAVFQQDMHSPLSSQLRSVESFSCPPPPFIIANPQHCEPMEMEINTSHSLTHFTAATSQAERFKRSAAIAAAPSRIAEKRIRKQTVHFQTEAKNLPEDEMGRYRLLARLPEEVRKWYAITPAEKDKEGKNSIKSVANIYRNNKDFLVEHDVKQEEFAILYNVNHNYLVTTLSKTKRREQALHSSSVDIKKFLRNNPIEKTLSGKYQASTVARYFIKHTAELEAEGINPDMLAEYTDTDPETLRKRISWARNNVVVNLPAKIKNWLKKHPILKGDNGKVIQRQFKNLWEIHQEEINRLGITIENMAAFNHTNSRVLLSIIKNKDTTYSRTPDPTEEQQNYLDAQSWKKDNEGNIIAEDVAKFYIDNKKELMSRKISREMLAVAHGLKPSSLILRIDKNPQRAADMQFKQQQVENWLKKHGPDKNQLPQKIPEKTIAKFFWEIKSLPNNQQKINASDLIRFYGLRQSVLHYHIESCAPENEKDLPTPPQKVWLEKHAPVLNKNDVMNAEDAAEYYVKHQDQLRKEGITNKKLAAYYNIPLSTFKARVVIAKQAYADKEISPEIQQFLYYALQQTDLNENSSKQLASMMLDYQPAFEINLATAAIITEQLGVSFAANTLMRRINELEKIRKAAEEVFPAEAIDWLDGFDAEYEHGMHYNATRTAMFYLNNLDKIKALKITPWLLAQRYNISATTLQTTVIRPKIIAKAATWQPKKKIPSSPVIKQEPEVQPWAQAKWGRDYPVIIPPEDARLTLGMEQGPLRELLMEENVATLKFNHFPAEYSRYKTTATQQLRKLVEAAQNGILRDRVKQQGNYYLLCDEQHPELGMGIAAARDLEPGVVVQLYAGVRYSGNKQYLAAAEAGDMSFPIYAFEHSEWRPRRKADGQKKRSMQAKTVIGGHYRTGDMAFANTAEIDEGGKAKRSESNNLVALKAGKAVIAFMTTCKVKMHDPLLIYYGDKYLTTTHQPYPLTREIKQEISEFEEKLQQLSVNQPALGWLVNNIHNSAAWTHPVYELMPQLFAQTPRLRQKDALLTIIDGEGIIIKIIDSATGADIAPDSALYSRRPLAVIQNQDENHYHCWWARGKNVSFSQAQDMAGNMHYQIESDDPCNIRQEIEPSGFCMSEAIATALLARDANKPLPTADRRELGQQLREQVRDFILAADDALCHALEAQVPQT